MKKKYYLFALILLLAATSAVGVHAWYSQKNAPAIVAFTTGEPRETTESEEIAQPAPDSEEEEKEEVAVNEEQAEQENQEAAPAEKQVKVTTKKPEQEVEVTLPAANKKKTVAKKADAPVKDTAKEPPVDGGGPSVTYTTYTVKQGDTFWLISQKVGIPMPELIKANNMNENTPLYAGMTLTVPQHHIPIKSTPGPQYGELLDWWTEAKYVWPIGTNAKVTDLATGKSFNVRRSYGAFHADVEPLTLADSTTMKEIWGGWSWATRPVFVEVNGRRIAASASAMPHDIQSITDNGFEGHFDIHFLNSTRHKDNLMQADHQENVRRAAGM
ncbi:MAG: LysM peptidoglycan-binding domain-containing protein [Firmicutes bacterium]|nr:LysM peptidoglycan-binding domain-containing protein [Bacillota bacterium]